MPRYLLVDDADGRVLAELASPEPAMRLLARVESADGDAQMSLVRVAHQQGDLFGVTSRMAIRPLDGTEAWPGRIPQRTRRRRRRL